MAKIGSNQTDCNAELYVNIQYTTENAKKKRDGETTYPVQLPYF